MSKDMFRGLVVGVILAIVVGWGILFVNGLNMRLAGVEKFLTNAINQNQQAQRPVTSQAK